MANWGNRSIEFRAQDFVSGTHSISRLLGPASYLPRPVSPVNTLLSPWWSSAACRSTGLQAEDAVLWRRESTVARARPLGLQCAMGLTAALPTDSDRGSGSRRDAFCDKHAPLAGAQGESTWGRLFASVRCGRGRLPRARRSLDVRDPDARVTLFAGLTFQSSSVAAQGSSQPDEERRRRKFKLLEAAGDMNGQYRRRRTALC